MVVICDGGQRAETWSLKPHALAARQRPRRRRSNAPATSTAAGKNVPGSGTETDTLGTHSPPEAVNVVAPEVEAGAGASEEGDVRGGEGSP
jgi:hypothetical protein